MDPSIRPEIERALHFIAEHLDRALTVAEVARAAHMSEFHLHRVFHSAVGESVGRFITRRRLELSALRLAYQPDRSITDIALSSGYSSSSNFSKAFSAYFGLNPARVREPDLTLPPSIGKLTELYGKDFRPEQLYSLPPDTDDAERQTQAALWQSRVRFETSEGMSFACLASPGGYDVEVIERTWYELIDRGRQLGLCSEDVDAWGMAHDSPQLTAPELCRYNACLPCPADQTLAAPLFRGRMLPGRYAVFRYAGEIGSMNDAYRSIYSCWFRESSVAPDDFSPLDHHVTDFPEQGRVELEIWFKVRARR